MWIRVSFLVFASACSTGNESTEQAAAENAATAAAPEEPGCAPLSVIVDGETVPMPHGLAVRSDEGVAVHLFNDDVVTCEQVIQGFWPTPAGQIHVVARQRIEGSSYATTDNRTTPAEVRTLSDEGGRVVLCVGELVDFPQRIGKPVVTLEGRFEGRVCER